MQIASGRVLNEIVLDPIPTTDLSGNDVDRIANETRNQMLHVLGEISEGTHPHTINGFAGVKEDL